MSKHGQHPGQHRGPQDDPLAGALRLGLQQNGSALDAAGCPSADLLASYFERSLPTTETTKWEAHFSACARCQQQLATLARIETAVGGVPNASTAAGFSFLNWRWLTAASAAAVGALAFWVAVQPAPVQPAVEK